MIKIVVVYGLKVAAAFMIRVIVFVNFRVINHFEVITELISNILLNRVLIHNAKKYFRIVMTFNPELNFASNSNSHTIFWHFFSIAIIYAHFYIKLWILIVNVSKHNRYNSS